MAQARMLNQRKRNKKGANSSYITRARALRKLQIPLADFRKLCILKGIYPREPKRKFDGADKTYYHVKDIKYLMHEPILKKFFDIKAFTKKHKKLMGRKEANLARRKEANKPTYSLEHIVKERYPQFDDALRDLDDALSMVALFQSLPANKSQSIEAKAITESATLFDEFQAYIMQQKCLRRCFASIKGYYFQAEILGQQATWLVPHQFAQQLPEEVDFRVMLTFLEFYRTLMKFINFKLFSTAGLPYPPQKDEVISKSGMRAAALTQVEQEEKKAGDDFKGTEEGAKMQEAAKESKGAGKVFNGLKFFISREVPFGPLHFVARCGGAQVGWEGEGSPFDADGEVTHFIVDRPKDQLKIREGCEYVQPQWILDCFNCKVLLPILDYAPGKVPPPHLSPFVDDVQEGYVPEQREVLNQLINQKREEEVEEEEELSDEEVEQKYQEELNAEQKGVWYSEFKENKEAEKEQILDVPAIRKVSKREREEAEEKERAKAMMTGKHRHLLKKIEHASAEKQENIDNLEKKRKKKKFEDRVKK